MPVAPGSKVNGLALNLVFLAPKAGPAMATARTRRTETMSMMRSRRMRSLLLLRRRLSPSNRQGGAGRKRAERDFFPLREAWKAPGAGRTMNVAVGRARVELVPGLRLVHGPPEPTPCPRAG